MLLLLVLVCSLLLVSQQSVHTSKLSASPGAMRCVCAAPLSLNQRVAGGLMRIDSGPVLFRFVTCTVAHATPSVHKKSSAAGVTASCDAMTAVDLCQAYNDACTLLGRALGYNTSTAINPSQSAGV